MNMYDAEACDAREECVSLPIKMLVNAILIQCESDVEAISMRNEDPAVATYLAGFTAALRMLDREEIADEIMGAALADRKL